MKERECDPNLLTIYWSLMRAFIDGNGFHLMVRLVPVADLHGWGDKRPLWSERQKGREIGLFALTSIEIKAPLDLGG
jgi:hypothetical protein